MILLLVFFEHTTQNRIVSLVEHENAKKTTICKQIYIVVFLWHMDFCIFTKFQCENAKMENHAAPQKRPVRKFVTKSWSLKNHISRLETDLDPNFSEMSYNVVNFIFRHKNLRSTDGYKNPLTRVFSFRRSGQRRICDLSLHFHSTLPNSTFIS